jgi:hypothetical protein
MPLEQNKLKKGHEFQKFIIFVSSYRQFRRFLYTFFSLFRLAPGPRSFTTGLFCFGYLPDSGANDPRLIGAQERELKEAVGETRVKGTVPVARERRSTDGTIRVGGIVSVCFLGVERKLFFLRSILKEKYVRELPNQRDRY